jgi:hypothetical protein
MQTGSAAGNVQPQQVTPLVSPAGFHNIKHSNRRSTTLVSYQAPHRIEQETSACERSRMHNPGINCLAKTLSSMDAVQTSDVRLERAQLALQHMNQASTCLAVHHRQHRVAVCNK